MASVKEISRLEDRSIANVLRRLISNGLTNYCVRGAA